MLDAKKIQFSGLGGPVFCIINPMLKRTLIFLFLALATSCSVPMPEKPPVIFWPAPPGKPRIKFIKTISGSNDVKGGPEGVAGYLFGDDIGVGFIKPVFAAAKNDVLYVTDLLTLHIYDFKNKKYTEVNGQLRTPSGVAAGPDGTVFVGDSTRKTIFKFDSSGRQLGTFGFINSPGGFAVDDARRRLVAVDAATDEVYVYSLSGGLEFKFGGKGAGPGQFNIPYGVAVDHKGNIIVVDSGNFRVQVFDKDGKFIRAFGHAGTRPGDFMRPKGIAIDSQGHLYVVDAAFGNFQIFDEKGNLYLFVGTNGAAPGQFQLPFGIAIDSSDDRIYVVDQINRRIQVFQYLKNGAAPAPR